MFDAIDLENLQAIAISAACGGILGIEREVAGKPAGIRTHIFVCAGSALMMILGQEIVNQFEQQETNSLLKADPIRILQAIVVGISFLGAGTIVHQKGEGVEGLTTAATIYLTAGIGVAVAVDRTGLALAVTAFAMAVLFLLGQLERRIQAFNDSQNGGDEGK
ncbi:putative Mg(2+) transport ATPase [Stieleria neptunia]|uniref:Putative Mg(2+) transport ATPase n=1 Tax=Stieleria neptunia TaxID=2527979 RepID=A0A518HLR4_9BACT|nr:MgtC/SapB family protein [Stieleria neptunia]QDV41786.1 putative Mg(2+) transport ATPase [Stieleria neptunia]